MKITNKNIGEYVVYDNVVVMILGKSKDGKMVNVRLKENSNVCQVPAKSCEEVLSTIKIYITRSGRHVIEN